VDKPISSADDFNHAMQNLRTEYCWDYVPRWPFPRDAPHELKTHVRGALTNWATRQEIREVCMHVAIDRGVPTGVNAFRNAREVFAELDQKK
jgi:4-carboxymuconolactone decarboxylase